MSHRFVTGSLLLLIVTLLWVGSAKAQVVINEFMAANSQTIEDPDEPGQYEDWIEVYNAGATAVDLGNMYLTDDLADPTRWQIPSGLTLNPGEHLIFWADNDEEQGDTHTNFKVSAGGEQIGLVDVDGQTLLDSLDTGQQGVDISFGRFPDGADTWCFMSVATPGLPNSACDADSAQFSRSGGTFLGSLEVEITTDSPSAEIYYTLDGREPDNVIGTRYTGPITIEKTTWLRARVYEAGLMPGPITSESYVALDPELETFNSNLPLIVVDTFGRNIDRETGGSRPFRPVLTVFIETNRESGRSALTDEPDYAGYGGMHVRGNSTTQYPKKQYRFETWDEFSDDKPVTLLGFPEESDWIFHAPYSDKTLMRNYLMYTWSLAIGRYAVRCKFVEMFIDSRGDGVVSMTDYHGVYVFMESVKRDRNRVDIQELDPTDNAEPEISGGYLLKKDWYSGVSFFRTATYGDGLIYVDPKPEEITAAQRTWVKGYFDEFEEVLAGPNFADPVDGYVNYVDVDSFIDHQLLVEMARNVDGYTLSTYVYKDREDTVHMGPIWDYNGALGGAEYASSGVTDGWRFSTGFGDNPAAYRWYERLWEDPRYTKELAERWHTLRKDVFRTESLLEDIDNNVALLTDKGATESAVVRNFDRWNILNRYVWPNHPNTVRGTYQDHVDWMKEWLTGRLAWMDEATAGLTTLPPEFSAPGGKVPHGFELALTAPEGEIYYTLNGPDPKSATGQPNAEANLYTAPIVINENTRVRARAFRPEEGFWSTMVTATYATDIPPLVVTEIMYDPPDYPEDSSPSTSRYEFLELYNAGDETIELAGIRLMRVTSRSARTSFDFSDGNITSLRPGEYVLLVRDMASFVERYGDRPRVAGEFSNALSNSGGDILLRGPLDETFIDFSYDGSWYPSTSGDVGHSLVMRDPTAAPETWSEAETWRPSHVVGGSPGEEDLPPIEGLQLRGDIDQDGRLGISDAVGILRYTVGEAVPPCERDEANTELIDVTGEGFVNLSDGLHIVVYLFLGGQPRELSPDCQRIRFCPEVCGVTE